MFKDFLTFEKMVTPMLIRIIYYLGVAGVLLTAIIMIIGGFSAQYGGGARVFMGLATLFAGPLFVRIWCEILIVAFQINNNLTEIRNNLKQQ